MHRVTLGRRSTENEAGQDRPSQLDLTGTSKTLYQQQDITSSGESSTQDLISGSIKHQ